MSSSLAQALSIDVLDLENGAKLLYKPMPNAPRLALSFFLPGGNQLDPSPGLSDIVDRLIMKGTKTRGQEDIALAIDGMTLEVDTDTKRDYNVIYATLLEEDLEASLALIADLFYNAVPDHRVAEDFAREKEKIAGEIMMELDSPKSRASDQLIKTIFDGTPYGVVSSVVLDNLPNLDSTQAVQAHYRDVYQPERAMISVAGNVARDKLVRLITQYFPSQRHPGYPILYPGHSALSQIAIPEDRYVSFARDDSNQAHIYKGWVVPSAQHPDYYPLVLMNTILGAGGLSSRLFIELRDKQGLAYNVRSSLEAYQHRGLFLIYIGTEPSNKAKCLQGFIDECDKLIQTPVAAKELDDAKRNVLGRRSVYLETAPQIGNYIGSNYVLGRTIADIEALPERIAAVTATDIQRVAQTYLSAPSVVSITAPSNVL